MMIKCGLAVVMTMASYGVGFSAELRFPVLNLAAGCKERANTGGPFDRGVYKSCMADQPIMRDKAMALWPNASNKVRADCIKYSSDIYASLEWCVRDGISRQKP